MADTVAKSDSPEVEGTPGEFKVLRLSTKTKKKDVEYVDLFEIDDVMYQVPKKPSPTIGLRFLSIMKHEGAEEAAYYMLTTMLGEEGYEALMNYEDLEQEQYDFVLQAAIRIATGKTENPKVSGKSQRPGSRGRRR
jgi:hypothetical protein